MACIHNRLPERGVWELQLNTDPVRTEGRIQLKKKATYRSYSKTRSNETAATTNVMCRSIHRFIIPSPSRGNPRTFDTKGLPWGWVGEEFELDRLGGKFDLEVSNLSSGVPCVSIFNMEEFKDKESASVG